MTRFVSRRNTYEIRLQVPYSQQFKFYRLVESKIICKFALHNKQRHTYRVDIHKRFAIGLLERNLEISTNHQQPALDACIPRMQANLWNRTGDWACQSLSKERGNGEAGILYYTLPKGRRRPTQIAFHCQGITICTRQAAAEVCLILTSMFVLKLLAEIVPLNDE